ncbi:MAG: hypothetical protein OSJ51_11845 [Parabacteroides distasonis]|nr:hypothetical protein [Parabacteroides distasonis]
MTRFAGRYRIRKDPGNQYRFLYRWHDWEDVVKCLLAGASADRCVALSIHMERKSSPKIDLRGRVDASGTLPIPFQFQGKLNYANIPNPAMLSVHNS